MAKPVYTLNQVIARIAEPAELNGGGVGLNNGVITYSFPTNYAATLNASQKAAAIRAFTLWDDLIATNITQSGTTTSYYTSVGPDRIKLVGEYDPTSGGYATGGGPTPPNSFAQARIVISTAFSTNMSPTLGNYGNITFLHEIGHALQLNHPGNYNGGSPTYASDAIYEQDTLQYTVMSYFGASNTGAVHKGYYAQTPLLHDIAAIQNIYGADYTTRATNTIYGFGSNTGQDVYNFSLNKAPIISIWDGGGTDTIDVSGWTVAQKIDLRQGAFSNVGGLTLNLSIAYGADIERATSGAGSDILIGNALANILRGGNGDDNLSGLDSGDRLYGDAGNDTIAGGNGNNYMDGGAGIDLLDYSLADQSVNVDLSLTTAQFTGEGNETILNFENLCGGEHADILVGNNLNNFISGKSANDILIGGQGSNTLSGDSGFDMASYEYATSAVKVSLSVATAQATGYSSDKLISIEALKGSQYNDTLTGSTGNNALYGENGADKIYGLAGNDSLYGGDGDDYLYGDAGSDSLFSGNGLDFLTGGLDADIFGFDLATAFSVADRINDFSKSQGDILDFSDILDGFTIDATTLGDYVRNVTSGTSEVVFIDRDGSGGAFNFTKVCVMYGAGGLDFADLLNDNQLVLS